MQSATRSVDKKKSTINKETKRKNTKKKTQKNNCKQVPPVVLTSKMLKKRKSNKNY